MNEIPFAVVQAMIADKLRYEYGSKAKKVETYDDLISMVQKINNQ